MINKIHNNIWLSIPLILVTIIILILLHFGKKGSAINTTIIGDYKVELLFTTPQGVSVYRFNDGLVPVYFSSQSPTFVIQADPNK